MTNKFVLVSVTGKAVPDIAWPESLRDAPIEKVVITSTTSAYVYNDVMDGRAGYRVIFVNTETGLPTIDSDGGDDKIFVQSLLMVRLVIQDYWLLSQLKPQRKKSRYETHQ